MFLYSGLLGVGYYGNETTAIGIHHFINSANGINDTVTNVDYKVGLYSLSLGRRLEALYNFMKLISESK